ncbi:hypothetical protein [Streptomyces platensis]|uniref:hypothetical protein n=1 Tax=Streptomyces platensis TaxID=58346 RepID=UPI002F911753|nr:hypothetical protein OG962_37420 [Streptomyces platensis]
MTDRPDRVPPMETIPDGKRIPPPRRPAPPRPQPSKPGDLPLGATIALGAVGLVVLAVLLKWTVPAVVGWVSHQDWHQLTQWLHTIDRPVHAYLAAHTVGLPLTATTAYVLWQCIGLGSLGLGFLTGSVGARLTWIAYGAATTVMVWSQTPAAGRDVATGLAVLAWTTASTLALRGLSLRPVIR